MINRSPQNPLVLALAVTFSWAAAGHAQRAVSIADGQACSRCAVTLEQVERLGTMDGAGALTGIPSSVVRDSRGRYLVSQYVSAHELLVFQDGRARVIGRRGEGPGEYRHIAVLGLGPGDSLHVFDSGNARLTLLTPDLVIGRSERLHGGQIYNGTVMIDGTPVLNAAVPTATGVGFPLHAVRDGSLVSFGSGDGAHHPGVSPFALMRALAPSQDGHIWAGARTRYQVELWSSTGELLQTVTRDARWFRPYDTRPIGSPHPPPPYLLGLREVRPGILVVMVNVAKPDYLRVRGAPIQMSERGEPMYDLSRSQDLYDTVIEVLDIRSGRLLHSKRVGGYLIGFADDDHVYGYMLDDQDVPRIEVYRIHVDLP